MITPQDDSGAVYAVPGEVSMVHRGHDGYISFVVFDADGRPQPGGIIPAAAAGQTVMSRSFAGHDNAFFTLHGMANGRRAMPRGDSIRWITCVPVDLDTRNVGLTPFQALDRIEPMIESGELLPYSAMVFSGRGLWLLWLLRAGDGEDEAGPVRDRRNRLPHYRCCRALHEKLARFGSDSTASALTKLARFPESINSKSGETVRWSFWGDAPGRPYLYTLRQLADSLGVDTTAPAPRPQNVRRKRSTDGRRPGWLEKHEAHRRALLELEAMRGGFRLTTRNQALYIYAGTLCALKYPREEAMVLVQEMANRCEGRMERLHARDVVKSTYKQEFNRFKADTIAERLDITPDESEVLGKNDRGIPILPCAPRFRAPIAAKDRTETRDGRREMRRNWIRHAYKAYIGDILPCTLEDVCRRMDNELGFTGAGATISADCRAVGVEPRPPVRPARKVPPLFPDTGPPA